MTTKLILRSNLSPGDIVMLTAAVRDLHAAYPGEYLTDVRTPCPALWEHNPHIVPIADEDPEARVIEMHYPLIQRSNSAPYHFIHGYRMHLEQELGRRIEAGAFRGDIHLSDEERGWMSQVEELEGSGVRYWIIVSGGKRDFTAKWWDPARYQAVVDHFAGRIRFVQVGEAGHAHPPLRGVLDLRGKTSLRQLVRLVHHADGVLCPVTSLMHLAAAVPVREGRAPLRPCVVVAGGREPSQWEAYPGHRYLDTVGALPCCAGGGCWKSRVVPLGDGDEKDASLCVRPVEVSGGVHIPQCMEMVSVEAVVRAVESYLVAPVAERVAELVATVVDMGRRGGAPAACCGKGTRRTPAVKPTDPVAWGPAKWRELHERPDKAGELSKEGAWLARFGNSLPCPECQEHFAALLRELPPRLESADVYFAWTVEAHNVVNRRLGKAEVSLEVASRERGARLAIAKRWKACQACTQFSPANASEGPRCALAGGLRAFIGGERNGCPEGRWGAVHLQVPSVRPVVRVTGSDSSRVGLVIGTYGAVPYIHLQLESLRRFHPGTPCLVVDDGSPQREQLAELCRQYGAEFLGRERRMGHVPGDMQAFIDGHEWANRIGIELLVKFSRRWVPIAAWIQGAVGLWIESRAPTLNNVCEFHGFGFRSECVAMDVSAWRNADALQVVREHIAACAEHPPDLDCGKSGILVEHVIHMAAAKAKVVSGWEAYRNFEEWDWMGRNRMKNIHGVLWHESSRAPLFKAVLKLWGFEYASAEFLSKKANILR